ncbi:MAG: DUF4405 domain-containing protein [Deltaproteobacteria bacterium]|nr:MAG: DUF4405 domain-containing protein [Deltaproteobacteria bacterium]
MENKKKGFNWRGWTTFVVIIAFIVDTISGIILYIAPHGRVANWTNWNIWGLNKEEWAAIHTIFGYILLIIVGVHLYYNWKVFMNFIWRKIRKALNLRWEMMAAVLLCLFVFLGTLWNFPPFSTTMNVGETLKDCWEESKAVAAPVRQAQELSLQEFAARIQAPVDQILSALKSKGFAVKNAQQTLEEIAKEYRTSPDKLYEAMTSEGVKPSAPQAIEGTGLGRKTLDTICSEKDLSIDEVLSRLKEKGIEAKASDRIRDIAGRYEKTPMEIFANIEGKD